MQISVILCTYNRCPYLRKALNSIAVSVLPKEVEWEVLVVDNNSSDHTSQIANEFVGRFPGRFRYLLEPRQGKSYALNTGIRESRGDILAFVDDDVTMGPDWLWNLTRALKDGEWAGTGGRTLLAEHFSPPRWLGLVGPHSMGGVLAAHFDLGGEPCELKTAPYGVNMAYRKVMFEKYGDFRADLGPCPGSEIRNEDTEFGRRLMAAGERLRYEPAAIVYHLVQENRIQKAYFLNWWFDFGRAQIREQGKRRDIWGIPRCYLRIAKIATVVVPQRMLRWLVSLQPSRRFFCKCFVWMTAGQIAELYRQRDRPKAQHTCDAAEMRAACKGRS